MQQKVISILFQGQGLGWTHLWIQLQIPIKGDLNLKQ